MISAALNHLFPGINLAPGGDCEIVEGQIVKWRRTEPQPDAAVLSAATEPALKAAAVSAIKTKARQVILARIPEWKQANMTARAVELVALGQTGGAEWAAMQTAWDWIKAVRAHSDALEAAAQSDPNVDIDAGWP